jgi:glucan-binding YG repeat protein
MNINKMKKTIFTTTLVICSMLIASCSDSGKSVSQQNQSNQVNTPTANQINHESTSANKAKLDNQENKKQTNNSTSSEKTPIKNNKPNVIENENPTFGTIKDMQNGDLKCYVNVVDANGKLHQGVGAIFEVCEQDKYINKNVSLSYELKDVNDCQSAEPCGKTIKEWLITKIEIQEKKAPDSSH